MGFLFCGKATAVATVHRTVAKSRLSNPTLQTPCQKQKAPRCVGFARLRAERWSALTATGSHSLPTLRIPLCKLHAKNTKHPDGVLLLWRREWDSNPRQGQTCYRFSIPDPSTTWVSLHSLLILTQKPLKSQHKSLFPAMICTNDEGDARLSFIFCPDGRQRCCTHGATYLLSP